MNPIRRIYYGDNLPIMRRMPAESVDLIYLDPPFNSKRDYNMPAKDDQSSSIESQVHVFADTWEWEQKNHAAYLKQIERKNYALAHTLKGIDAIIRKGGPEDRNKSGALAYLTNMSVRLIEMHRILKRTGSLYLHCDPNMSHYLKLALDAVFGTDRFRNEIVWHYTGGGRSKTYFSRKHDIIFYYVKDKSIFNLDDIRVPYKETSGYSKSGIVSKSGKQYLPNPKGTPVDDVWDIPIINPLAKERTGYPTQKPMPLLERIIQASSKAGDVVLDPFCGCGTTILAAEKLGRQWIGIDSTYHALKILRDRFEGSKYAAQFWQDIQVAGDPYSPREALVLAELDQEEFEKFAVRAFGGQHSGKRGSDAGIDGYFTHLVSQEGAAAAAPPQTARGIIQVKGGASGNWRQYVSALHSDAQGRAAVLITAGPQQAAVAHAKQYENVWVYEIAQVMEGTHRQDFRLQE